jgi:hypothetical protein
MAWVQPATCFSVGWIPVQARAKKKFVLLSEKMNLANMPEILIIGMTASQKLILSKVT